MKNISKNIGFLSVADERVIAMFETAPDVADKPGAKPVDIIEGGITFEHVSFTYENGMSSLSDINFSIKPQQQVAIIGPPGAGKTTITNIILRLYDPANGKVFVDGVDIQDYQVASWRKNISIVLQDSLLFKTTIRENISYDIENATTESIQQAAKLANAHGFIKNFPQGYDTVIGEPGTTLSIDQKQRIAIARAAMRDTPIVILDEPTLGLDKKHEKIVRDAINKLCANRTTFLVTHDVSNLDVDRVLYFINGKLVGDGTPKELLTLNRNYAELLNFSNCVLSKKPEISEYSKSR